MATITGNGSKGHHKFTLEVNESSYNVNENTSDVTYTLKIAPIQKGWDWNASGVSYVITINGSQVATGSISKYDGSSTTTIKSSSVTGIAHNSDGTKTISIGFTITDSTSYSFTPGNASASGSLTLTTIPRASQIGVADANIGSSTNITINKNSQSFTTTLYYKASGQSSWTKIVDKTSNQVYAWTVPTSFYALIPNSKTISCQFYADTYNGSTLVGTSNVVSATFTATGSPIISGFTLVDTNSTTTALTGDSSKMVRYASNVRATITASGQNSASVSSIKVNGTTASSGVVNFNGASTNSFQAVVTDSRGYTTSQTKTMTMVNYVQLTLNASIVRNQPTDGNVKISYNGNYFSGSFGNQTNSLTVQYRSREKNGTWGSWTDLSPTISGNTYRQSNYIISGYDYQKQYEFEIRAVDKVKSKPITGINVPKGKPVYWWNDEGFYVNGNFNVSGYTGELVVESIKSKNLIDGWVAGAINSTTGAISTGSSVEVRTGLIEVDFTNNSAYTLSGMPSSNYRHFVAAYNSSGQFLGRTGANITAGDVLTTSSFTGGTPQGTGNIKFLAITLYSSVPTSAYKNAQLEEGNTATSFNEYQNLDGLEIYSAIEKKIGKWINSKPIYRKVVTFTPVTNALQTIVSHGISNCDEILPTSKCMLYRTNNQFVPFSMTYPNSASEILAWSIGWQANRSQIYTWIGSSMRGQMDTSRGYGAVAILEYTKTTDY